MARPFTHAHTVTLNPPLFPFHAHSLSVQQSNMDMVVSNCFYANETLAASPQYSDIVYKHGPGAPWVVGGSSNASLADFSAVCWFTAMHLKQSIPAFKDVPIGLVQSSVGGKLQRQQNKCAQSC